METEGEEQGNMHHSQECDEDEVEHDDEGVLDGSGKDVTFDWVLGKGLREGEKGGRRLRLNYSRKMIASSHRVECVH